MRPIFRCSISFLLCFSLAWVVAGCEREGSIEQPSVAAHPHDDEAVAHDDHDHEHDIEHDHDHEPEVGRVIAVPESVRRNLGITFATVERRAVARTIRAPGRFELLPKARREYRTMLSGQVELHIGQYDRVEPGVLLYRLDSPAWRELQERLNEADSTIRQATARVQTMKPLMDAHREHEESLRENVSLWTERVQRLEKGGNVIAAETVAQARSTLSQHRSDLAVVLEKEAELEARRMEVEAELSAAWERFDLLLMNAATLLGMEKETLTTRPAGDVADAPPLWRRIARVEVRAAVPGVVESLALTDGSWATETSLVLATIQPELMRFRASGLQSDLGRLRNGLPARIVPPKGGSIRVQDTMEGTIRLGPLANPDERTVEILMTPERVASWARPGVAAHLEIVTEGSGQEELAVPMSATVRDGLATVLFRRNPGNPDEVIRVEGNLGVHDGRWVAVKSGLREGDEVVLDGVYQLMLASSASAQQGGHYDSDGTFHTGSH